jgi:nitrogen fixation NifU-like protein
MTNMRSDDEEIYLEHVMDHYEDPYHRGHCEGATHTHEDDNPLCGDVVQVELRIGADGRVEEAWFDGDGCCISQASASMLIETIEGRTVDEIKKFSAADMLKLFEAKLTPNRQKCCLLPWRVVQTAVFSPIIGNDANDGGPNVSGSRAGKEP